MRMTASWFRSHVDRPNTRVWRDDPRPMASSPLIVDARLSPSNLSSSLRAGSDDGTRAATGIFGRRDRANRAAVPSVHIAMLTRLIRMEAKWFIRHVMGYNGGFSWAGDLPCVPLLFACAS